MFAPSAHVRCSSLHLLMTLVLRSSREPPVASGFSFVGWGPPSAGSVTCFCFNILVSRWRPVNCSFLRNWRKTLSPSLIQIEAACRAEQRMGRPASRQLLRYEHGESDERRGCVLRRPARLQSHRHCTRSGRIGALAAQGVRKHGENGSPDALKLALP